MKVDPSVTIAGESFGDLVDSLAEWSVTQFENGSVRVVVENGGEAFAPWARAIVEILSSDWARDIIRKAAKYAAAGVERYWIIDPDGPTIIVHELIDGILAERGRHGPGTVATLDVGSAEVTFDPARLVE